jgi:hypothetical protein
MVVLSLVAIQGLTGKLSNVLEVTYRHCATNTLMANAGSLVC